MSEATILTDEQAEARSDETVGRSALRKATWRLLPLIGLGYGIAYMDRINISFAALQMNRDLQFSDTVYGLGGGLFFLSYALCEVPSNPGAAYEFRCAALDCPDHVHVGIAGSRR